VAISPREAWADGRSWGFHREEVHWEDHLLDLTPVEEIGDLLFKREDKFAPLGYGAINGSKLRQCIWLICEYTKTHPNPVGVLSGASVKSPQLPMGTAVARHFGLDSIHVIGGTSEKAACRRENVAIATWLGARFFLNPIGYNPALQSRVRKLRESRKELRDYYILEYGITIDRGASDERVEAFHRLGAQQVRNIPKDVETLLLPAGSCNSCVSILYGTSLFPLPSLRKVVLFGIGPNRLEWIENRLATIEKVSGREILGQFRREYRHNPDEQRQYDPGGSPPYTLVHHDLHTTGYATYQDEMPFRYGGVELHPTYEGKIFHYMKDHPEEFQPLIRGRALFWNVGSKPCREAMAMALGQDLGPFPDRVRRYE